MTIESTSRAAAPSGRVSRADLLRRPASLVVAGVCLILASAIAGPILGLSYALIGGFAVCGLAARVDLVTGLIPNRLGALVIHVAPICALDPVPAIGESADDGGLVVSEPGGGEGAGDGLPWPCVGRDGDAGGVGVDVVGGLLGPVDGRAGGESGSDGAGDVVTGESGVVPGQFPTHIGDPGVKVDRDLNHRATAGIDDRERPPHPAGVGVGAGSDETVRARRSSSCSGPHPAVRASVIQPSVSPSGSSCFGVRVANVAA